ncbi:alkaline phosphatase [Gaoshiqia sp. Z1-71]|uniref:alkaline phosphatase n=1 Tax=Gaoshiqia hydrogeniformans TaxID=3290090 RepID=UPI003BF7746F
MKKSIILMVSVFLFQLSYGQENYKTISPEDSVKVYSAEKNFYPVKIYEDRAKTKKPRNIILMIGDGMGTAQVSAAVTANGGQLFLSNFKHLGFSNTHSANNYITDSAAGGTALSTGYRTSNGAIGVDVADIAKPTILDIAESKGKMTGLVSSSAITHATPASFIAHQPSRNRYEEIAADFLKTDIDVFIGGGYKHFTNRKDGRDLTVDLKAKGYQVLTELNEIVSVKSGKLAGLTAPEHNDRYAQRGDLLPKATETAIRLLRNQKAGFFLMVEGSQIDWAGHQNNTIFLIEEMLDFDRTIGVALEFAAEDNETLIVVTSDHETGGLALTGGNLETGMVKGTYNTGSHTGVMVPVFAFGPGAEQFTGIMDNTDIAKKIISLIENK